MDDLLAGLAKSSRTMVEKDGGDWYTLSVNPVRILAAAEKPDSGVSDVLELFAKYATDAESWPPKNREAATEKGQLAKVDTCEVSGKEALATCSWSGGEGSDGNWQAKQSYYSVAETIDTDVAFKRCIHEHGKWAALDATDDRVMHERARQHGAQTRDAMEKLRRMTE
ncbi:MAG: hypothetical protein ABI321_11195 [Polyangia bacterium]